MSKDKSIVVVEEEEAATEAEEGKEKEEEGLEQEEEELEIATASGGDSDGSEVSDALEVRRRTCVAIVWCVEACDVLGACDGA